MHLHNNADKPSLSSTDATKTFFNIDYTPLNDLKKVISDSSGKAGVKLQAPTSVQFVLTTKILSSWPSKMSWNCKFHQAKM